MINTYVLENLEFLKQIYKTKSDRKRVKMLKSATTQQLLALAEIALNIRKFRIPLRQSHVRNLEPYAAEVRKLSRSRSEKSAKKVIQIGGGPMIAALLAPALIELGRYLIERKLNG